MLVRQNSLACQTSPTMMRPPSPTRRAQDQAARLGTPGVNQSPHTSGWREKEECPRGSGVDPRPTTKKSISASLFRGLLRGGREETQERLGKAKLIILTGPRRGAGLCMPQRATGKHLCGSGDRRRERREGVGRGFIGVSMDRRRGAG